MGTRPFSIPSKSEGEKLSKRLFIIVSIAALLAVGVVARLWPPSPGPRAREAAPPAALPRVTGDPKRGGPAAPDPGDEDDKWIKAGVKPDLGDHDAPAPPPLQTELTSDQERALSVALREADGAPTLTLITSLKDAIAKGDGRQVFYSADLLGWALAHDGTRLGDLERVIRDASTDLELRRTLICIIGTAGTAQARARLLEWAEDPSLKAAWPSILDELVEVRTFSLHQIQHDFSEEQRQDGKDWSSLSFHGGYGRTTDTEVIRVMLAHLQDEYPTVVKRTAASNLEMLSDPKTMVGLTQSTVEALKERFWSLRSSDDRTLRDAATNFLSGLPDPEIGSWLWSEYELPGADYGRRCRSANALARRTRSIEDVSRVMEAARRETDPGIRDTFVMFSLDFAQSTEDRAAVAQQLVGWLTAETDEQLRFSAVRRLGRLLPQSKPYLEQALQDPSERVRSAARSALRH